MRKVIENKNLKNILEIIKFSKESLRNLTQMTNTKLITFNYNTPLLLLFSIIWNILEFLNINDTNKIKQFIFKKLIKDELNISLHCCKDCKIVKYSKITSFIHNLIHIV